MNSWLDPNLHKYEIKPPNSYYCWTEGSELRHAQRMHDNGFLFLDSFDLFWEMGNDTGQTLKDIQTCQLLFLHTSLVRGKMALMKGRGDSD